MEQITIEMRIIKVKPKREIRKGGGKKIKQGKRGVRVRLMCVHCLRVIQSKLTSHQPRHQQKSAEEKDERR